MQTLRYCKEASRNRLKIYKLLTVDTKDILPIFFWLENPCNPALNRFWNGTIVWRYRMFTKLCHRIYIRWLAEEKQKQNDAFRTERRGFRVSRYRIVLPTRLGARFACKFHCAIVCKALQWSITRVDRSINASKRKRENRSRKGVIKICSCAYLFLQWWRIN